MPFHEGAGRTLYLALGAQRHRRQNRPKGTVSKPVFCQVPRNTNATTGKFFSFISSHQLVRKPSLPLSLSLPLDVVQFLGLLLLFDTSGMMSSVTSVTTDERGGSRGSKFLRYGQACDDGFHSRQQLRTEATINQLHQALASLFKFGDTCAPIRLAETMEGNGGVSQTLQDSVFPRRTICGRLSRTLGIVRITSGEELILRLTLLLKSTLPAGDLLHWRGLPPLSPRARRLWLQLQCHRVIVEPWTPCSSSYRAGSTC